MTDSEEKDALIQSLRERAESSELALAEFGSRYRQLKLRLALETGALEQACLVNPSQPITPDHARALAVVNRARTVCSQWTLENPTPNRESLVDLLRAVRALDGAP